MMLMMMMKPKRWDRREKSDEMGERRGQRREMREERTAVRANKRVISKENCSFRFQNNNGIQR